MQRDTMQCGPVPHIACLQQVEGFPSAFQGKQKVKTWISKLHNMPASQELTENESRQLLFDLESSYTEFMSVLPQLQGS